MTPTMDNLIPLPVSVSATGGTFVLTDTAAIEVEPGMAELMAIGHYLADTLRPATGYGLPVRPAASPPGGADIYLTTAGGDPGEWEA